MKPKLLITTLALSFPFSNSFTQGTWTQKADFGGAARYGAIGFSIGSYGYLGMGFNGSINFNDLWEYDQLNNSWTQKANCPGAARRVPVAFSIGAKGYVGTGYNGTHLKDFWEYDPAANSWTQKANFGGSARYGTIGFAINGKGYIGLGNEGSAYGPFLNDMWEYNPNLDTWTPKANFPGNQRYTATGFAIGSKGYVACGTNPPDVYNDLYEFDPYTNSWSQKADLPGVGKVYPFSFSIWGKGFVGGGQNAGGNPVSDVYSYNPNTNIWEQVQNYAGAGSHITAYFSIGDIGYVGTGYDMVNYYNEFWEYALPDTCFITMYDSVLVYDTTIVTIYDTVAVYDTIAVYDTVTVYSYIAVTDTLIIDVPLGLTPPDDINTLKIYPNPAQDHITIDNGNFVIMNGYSLEIKNSLGQQVFQSPINQQQFFIDLSAWTGNGTYFVFLYDPQSNIKDVRKIILQ